MVIIKPMVRLLNPYSHLCLTIIVFFRSCHADLHHSNPSVQNSNDMLLLSIKSEFLTLAWEGLHDMASAYLT